jgi:putative transposase
VLTKHGVPIAPETYYARRRRPTSTRAGRDELVLAEIIRVDTANRGGLYGARKVYSRLRREGVLVAGTPMARCTVERLMRTHGLVGVRRGRRVRTTLPDNTAARPADLVGRQFTAAASNQLWVVDFTSRRGRGSSTPSRSMCARG